MSGLINNIKYNLRLLQAKYYAKKLLIDFDPNWFKGKRVVIIGGADSVLKEKLGDYIDNFDVVVRVNRGVEVIEKQKEYVGTRTDFLFHSFMDNPQNLGSSPITSELWKKNKVGKLIYGANFFNIKDNHPGIYDLLLFVRKTAANLNFSEVSNSIYLKNRQAISPFRPTHGFIAINTVFECAPKEIYITGVTFFKTAHNTAYRKENINKFQEIFTGEPGSHNPDAEYDFVKKLYLKNPAIIKPDNTLEEIFKSN